MSKKEEPVTIAVRVNDTNDNELNVMSSLTQVMTSIHMPNQEHRAIDRNEEIRIANWFHDKYGEQVK